MEAPNTATASTVEAVVAVGRTVIGSNGKKFGAGAKVKLSAAEVITLTELGFLVDANAVIKKQTGPHIGVSSGPTVRIA